MKIKSPSRADDATVSYRFISSQTWGPEFWELDKLRFSGRAVKPGKKIILNPGERLVAFDRLLGSWTSRFTIQATEGGVHTREVRELPTMSASVVVADGQLYGSLTRLTDRNRPDSAAGAARDRASLAVLNTSIITADGGYTLRTISLDEARAYVDRAGGLIDSAVGHAATAAILTDLLGVEVPVNRQQYVQGPGEWALVFKLDGRLAEGAILDRATVEQIGYTLKLLTRHA